MHIALTLLTAALALLAFAPTSQAKVVVDTFGFPGPEGGHLTHPTGIAINQTGAGGVSPGTIYVADGDNNRIQRFGPSGDFERAWGFDVVQGGGTGFEICTVAAECKRGSTAEPARGGQVKSPTAIAVNQSTGNVYVDDSGNRRIEEFDPNGNFLRAWGWDVVSSGGSGDVSSNAFEICTVAADCKRGAESSSGGGMSEYTRGLVFDPSGNLWVSDPIYHRFEEFEPNGNFIAAYGWDVDALGGSGGLEKCTSTAPGACQAATTGTALGQFGAAAISYGPSAFAIDSAGFVYAIDVANKRIQRFDPAMTSASLFAPELLEEAGPVQFERDDILAVPGGHFLLGVQVSAPQGVNDHEHRLLELDESGHLLETSLAGAGVPALEPVSLARNEVTGAVYATIFNLINDGPGLLVIDDGPVTLPTVAIDPVTTFDAESATLSASVDPVGKPVANCKFQYSTDQVEWIDVPEEDCASLDVDGGSQPLSEAVVGLEPGTHYFVRFSAARYYNNEPALTGEVEFTTPSAPPIVSDVGAAQVTGTSAYLAGEVKARSQSSEYHFEHGTTPALGSSTPTVGLTGSKQQIVSQQITGLNPETTYYLRLVATNVAGSAESPIVNFRTRPSTPPGAQRIYEQVTPPDKNFSNADFSPPLGVVAADGEAAAFCMTTGFGDLPGQITAGCTDYRSVRTPSGWHTRWYGEPFCSFDSQETKAQTPPPSGREGVSANLDFTVLVRPETSSCSYPPLDPAAPTPHLNIYRADFRSDPIAYDLLNPQPGAKAQFLYEGGKYAAASEDWSHVIYTSTGQQTPDAPAGEFTKVFDWTEGALKLASIDPAGNPLTSASRVLDDALHGVSADGSRIFFMAPTSAPEIYMRQAGTKTFDVSQSECTSSCGESAADEFLAATPSGAKVAFMSKARLTNEDAVGNGSDLYLYTHSPNPAVNKNLTLLSPDAEPADGKGAEVLGLLGMSEDGETVYFAAKGQIVAGAPTDFGPKLYRWRANGGSPTLDYLATLTAEGAVTLDAGNWGGEALRPRSDIRQVSADGAYLLFHTTTRLDRGADHDSDRDVYRWSQADGWFCLSCQAPAVPSAGPSHIAPDSGTPPSGGAIEALNASNHYRNVMSADGKRVFFTSNDALVPGDVNERQDVYEWHEDGTVSLISTGTDTAKDVQLVGASSSGDDVFFTTYERLVGWDVDNSADIYDARIGGGFPEPPPIGAPCEGEACRGAPSSAPPPVGAGTAAFQGPGNVSAKGKGKGGKHHKKRHHKKKVRHHKRHRAAKHNKGAAR